MKGLRNIASLITMEGKNMNIPLQLSAIYCKCNFKEYCNIIHNNERKNIKFLFYLSGTLLYMSTSGTMLTLIIIQELLQKTNEVSIYKNNSVFWLGIILDRLVKNCIK